MAHGPLVFMINIVIILTNICEFSGFPTGGFSHSFGLEAAIRCDSVTNKGKHDVISETDMSRPVIKPTKWHMRPAKTQISLGICPV